MGLVGRVGKTEDKIYTADLLDGSQLWREYNYGGKIIGIG